MDVIRFELGEKAFPARQQVPEPRGQRKKWYICKAINQMTVEFREYGCNLGKITGLN